MNKTKKKKKCLDAVGLNYSPISEFEKEKESKFELMPGRGLLSRVDEGGTLNTAWCVPAVIRCPFNSVVCPSGGRSRADAIGG